MDTFENDMLNRYENFCMYFAHRWLRRHNIMNYREIWEDALQCARLGFLLYLRRAGITRAEDVTLYNNKVLYWSMYKELSAGILVNAMAPCGIHRPDDKLNDVKYKPVPLTEALGDERQGYTIDLSTVTVENFLKQLHGSDRQVTIMRMAGMKPGEIRQRLGLPKTTYCRRVKRIQQRWGEM